MNSEVELMYRPPNRKRHITLVQALDEIFVRLDKIEAILSTNPPKAQKSSILPNFIKKWL